MEQQAKYGGGEEREKEAAQEGQRLIEAEIDEIIGHIYDPTWLLREGRQWAESVMNGAYRWPSSNPVEKS
jgi:hypothetical protein